jgi:DNA repair protein RadD
MQLRDYQLSAVNSCWEYISTRNGNPVIVLPTGAGKSLVLAQLAHDAATKWGGRVIILAHVKELLEQNRDKLKAISPDLDIGVYSAGLNQRDKHAQVLVAGIQSVYQRACDFDPFDVIIVDESHLIPDSGEGMYRSFLTDCQVISPHVRLIGLTATPYRMSTGWLCGPDNLLNDICYEVGVKELIQAGWLCRLVSKEVMALDTGGLHIRGGEFVQDEAALLMADVIAPACQEILNRTEARRSVLIFTQSVEHCYTVARTIQEVCLCRVAVVTGDTPAGERAEILTAFKNGAIKYLVNVNVLTTGFDAPNIDCICLLRPTMSPGLYYQMTGRGLRPHASKTETLVLDFAGNVRRHGPIDQINPKPRQVGSGENTEAPTKTCPNCQTVCHAGFSLCPDCGHEFPDRNAPKHNAAPDNAPITSLETVRTDYAVMDVKYFEHHPRDGRTPTMRVDYKVNPVKWFSEWICFQHEGWARSKAVAWWKARSPDAVPDNVSDAVAFAKAGALAFTEQITVQEKAGDKWPRVVKVKLGPMPERIEATGNTDFEFPVGDEEEQDYPF